ncbi:endonuclease domain-containing protein [Plectonema cf. radiosum LEGE 06105]|uniref:Endonuclease domain-containing protein n=1 Tax=Plectonema cf. radiosum LEGE 06105 TaxID=945769 RepID=A0A8J7K539_9CYAN|nr:endonuclease domain-containing protein [Plectonema radiosum]MBE9216772.1 endonuclease domain-containing protein [Plectonema cf. radiosum LEGE 06105]
MTKFNEGDFYLPYNPDLITRAKELRKNMTSAEKKLWYGYLKNFKFRVLRQRPIDNFIVDFYCRHLKLVIEIDGECQFTDVARKYDQERTQRLEGYGLRVIRFTNQQVLNDFEAVCERLNSLIPSDPPWKGGNF